MKKSTLMVVVTAAAVTVGLAGCVAPTTQAPAPAPAPAPAVEAAPVEAAPLDMEAAGLDVLRDMEPAFNAVPDQQIIDAAVATCSAFDAGATFEDIFLASLDSGLTPEQVGVLTGFAVGVYCPEYQSIVG